MLSHQAAMCVQQQHQNGDLHRTDRAVIREPWQWLTEWQPRDVRPTQTRKKGAEIHRETR